MKEDLGGSVRVTTVEIMVRARTVMRVAGVSSHVVMNHVEKTVKAKRMTADQMGKSATVSKIHASQVNLDRNRRKTLENQAVRAAGLPKHSEALIVLTQKHLKGQAQVLRPSSAQRGKSRKNDKKQDRPHLDR